MHSAMTRMMLKSLCMLRVNVLSLTCGGDETQSQVAVNTDKIRLCGDSLNVEHIVLMAIPQRVIRRRMALGDRFRRVAKGWQLRRDVAIAQIAVQT